MSLFSSTLTSSGMGIYFEDLGGKLGSVSYLIIFLLLFRFGFKVSFVTSALH